MRTIIFARHNLIKKNLCYKINGVGLDLIAKKNIKKNFKRKISKF